MSERRLFVCDAACGAKADGEGYAKGWAHVTADTGGAVQVWDLCQNCAHAMFAKLPKARRKAE